MGLRLLEYRIVKNCRTNVDMIGNYYAAHIQTNFDAGLIHVMRPKPKKNPDQTKTQKTPAAPDPKPAESRFYCAII
jgi:hypothetical protein